MEEKQGMRHDTETCLTRFKQQVKKKKSCNVNEMLHKGIC